MRFNVGPIPDAVGFEPESEGFRPIREPDPLTMQFVAIPVLLVTAAAISLFLLHATPIPLWDVWKWVLPVFPFVVVVHELVHALVHPGNGREEASLLGCWPSRLLFYAHYDAGLTRERFLAILLAPFIALTVVPLAWLALAKSDSLLLGAVAAANGVGACGDLLGVLLIVFQIPRGALVRNKGWRSYWKPRGV